VETWGTCDLGLALARQKHTKAYVEKYLHTMPVGTRAAVFGTWYPGSLRVLQGVTPDRDLLSAAVNTMPFDQDGMVMLSPSTVPATGPPEDWCAQQERRNRMTLEALQQMAADLAQIKGRKNLLWFTMRIRTLVDQHPTGCLDNHFAAVQKAYGLLAAAEVTVYPISVRGVEPNSEEHAQDLLGLETVAEATGGKAYYNSNDLGDLTAQAMSAGADYYTLSYIPPGNEYDGRHHSIKIVAAKPGLKLAYRDEYYADDPRTSAPASGLTLAAAALPSGAVDMRTEMARSMPTATGLLFDVQVEPSLEADLVTAGAGGAPTKPTDPQVVGVLAQKLKGKPLTRYGFQYALPGKQIALTTTANGLRHGSLEFDLAAYDGDGNVVTSWRQAVQLNLSAEQAAQLTHSPFRYFQQLDLPAGALFVRVGVLDRTSNKVGTLEIPVSVAKPVHTASK
jgi:VWFA-related protein